MSWGCTGTAGACTVSHDCQYYCNPDDRVPVPDHLHMAWFRRETAALIGASARISGQVFLLCPPTHPVGYLELLMQSWIVNADVSYSCYQLELWPHEQESCEAMLQLYLWPHDSLV